MTTALTISLYLLSAFSGALSRIRYKTAEYEAEQLKIDDEDT